MGKGESKNVYKVYDKIAGWFSKNRYAGLMEKTYLDDMLGHLPTQAAILDLGCGTGTPILKYLIGKGLNVTGVDASTEMLGIARADFPLTDFILQDMRLLNLNRTFDAIIAWHSFFHLPSSDQPVMFRRFAQHLNPNGILLFTSGTEHGEAWAMNGGENLHHASLDLKAYELLLQKHRFKVLKRNINDPDCGHATVWMAKYTR